MGWGLDVSHHARISQRGGEKIFSLTSLFSLQSEDTWDQRGRDSEFALQSDDTHTEKFRLCPNLVHWHMPSLRQRLSSTN